MPLVNGQKLRLYSNSSISAYRSCPRRFYYSYVLGWKLEAKDDPLIFGSAWHTAMDVIWQADFNDLSNKYDVIEPAYAAFLNSWEAEGGVPLDELSDMETLKKLGARTPMVAQEMMYEYVDRRASFIRDFDLIDYEYPFGVPVDPEQPDLFYVGKIDKIGRLNGNIVGIEHKTTTQYRKSDTNPFRYSFVEDFYPDHQVEGYQYTLHMLYEENALGGIYVDGALVHKDVHDGFIFIPVEEPLSALNLWLWEVRNTIDEIDAHLEISENTGPTEPYMAAFPRDTNRCHSFGKSCPYLEQCRVWPNPRGKPMPPGFAHAEWNPLEHLNEEKLTLLTNKEKNDG